MTTNRVQLIGYVGKHFPAKETSVQTKRLQLRVATHQQTRSKNGERKWTTIWHDVIAWDKTADYAERNFVKGSKILVEGELTYRTYEDQQGHTRYLTQITAKNLLNLDR